MTNWAYVLSIVKALFLFQIVTANAQYAGFDSDISGYSKKLNLPVMAVGVAKGDSLIFFRGIGAAVPGGIEGITADHIFAIASVTKTFTSVLLQQFEEEGKLSLNDKLDSFPNRYFNSSRWDSLTTLAHIISHTSESEPGGQLFAYNGSKYNLVYNAFSKLNPLQEGESITRPFTKELEDRILKPLGMNHTLVRYSEKEHSHLKRWVVIPYEYLDSLHRYESEPIDLEGIESGPAYGMMSSIRDLITYSNSLTKGLLISHERYLKITNPFYPGSPQGMGWFTKTFEGIELHWAYGYGLNNSALFLKVPQRDLTLVILAPTTVPSEASRLGYGNPLNHPLVDSFLRNFVLGLRGKNLLYDSEAALPGFIKNSKGKLRHGIYAEEAFASATLLMLSPTSDKVDRERGIKILKWMNLRFPNEAFWNSTTAMELFAGSEDIPLMQFGARIARLSLNERVWPPSKLYYYALLEEKLGHENRAVQLYKKLADGHVFKEQQYKFDAMMKLAVYFQHSSPKTSREYLSRLMRYKNILGVQDSQYKAAEKMYNSY